MKKKIVALFCVLLVVASLSVAALAEGEGSGNISGVQSAVTDGLTSAAGSMMYVIQSIAPIAIGIVAAILVITIGIKVFKKITGR